MNWKSPSALDALCAFGLALLPAAGIVAAPAVALAVETPEAKAERLQRELADVLNEAWGGRFGAEVFPSRDIPHEVGGKFFDIANHCERWRQGKVAIRYAEFLREGAPMDRARHHAQELKLAMRQTGNPIDVAGKWYGDDMFVVIRSRGAALAEREEWKT